MPRSNQSRRLLFLEALEERTLLSAAPTPVVDLSGLTVDPSAEDPTQILVRFAPSVTPAPALAGTTIGQAPGLVSGLYEVDLGPGVTVAQALAAYRAAPGVVSAEPNYLLRAAWTPNDPSFSSQWDMNNTGQGGGTPGADIKAPAAWGVITSSPRMVVAVMDSGIDYDHPDLYLNLWLNQAEIPKSRLANLVDVDHDGYISFRDLNNPINQGPGKITDLNHDGVIDAGDILQPMVLNAQGQDTGQGGWAYPGNTQDGDTAHPNDFIGWNSNANTNNPMDGYGHGTHLAGTIGAVGNNGTGVAGINWNIQLMPVKFLNDSGYGSIAQFIAGLNYAVAHGAKISNNSWDGAPYSQDLYDAIANARAHGQIFVAAAGNAASNLDNSPSYPASFALDNIVTVAATDQNDKLASFSNYGPHSVELAAPGVNILSTNPGKSYGLRTGTSMAVPHVVGVLALVWTLRPEWNYLQVINQVLSTVDKLPALTGKLVTGGRLDAFAAVKVPPRTATATTTVKAAALTPAPSANGGGQVKASEVSSTGTTSSATPQSGGRSAENTPATDAGSGGVLAVRVLTSAEVKAGPAPSGPVVSAPVERPVPVDALFREADLNELRWVALLLRKPVAAS
jgi:subtilisin family serine protease